MALVGALVSRPGNVLPAQFYFFCTPLHLLKPPPPPTNTTKYKYLGVKRLRFKGPQTAH